MSQSEKSFMELMQGEGLNDVVPLKQSDKVDLQDAIAKRDEGSLQERRIAATSGENEGFSIGEIVLLNPLDPVGWKRDGVQEGVYRNLRLGKYQVDARLDLIRKSIPQCLHEFQSFIAECIKYDIRTVLVNHGRSKERSGMGNRQKSYLNLWLQLFPDVMAFRSAQPQHGGIGAIYVLLKKSDEKRLDNWEKHQKR